MEGWLIYNKMDAQINKHFIHWFQYEANQQSMSLHLILRENIKIGINNQKNTIKIQDQFVSLPDYAIVRTVEPLLNWQLEMLGINVYNNSDISRICNHKGLTLSYVSQLSIPVNDTLFIDKHDSLSGSAPMSYPFVIKEVGGRGGQQIYLISYESEWKQTKQKTFTDDIIIQSTQNIQFGKDVRVFIVGEQIIGAVLRENKHDFRANYKLGGSASWYPLNAYEISLVNQIINSFDFGMVGIDFLLDHNGRFVFNEIEDVVGSRTLSAVSDINILKHYIQYIKSGNTY